MAARRRVSNLPAVGQQDCLAEDDRQCGVSLSCSFSPTTSQSGYIFHCDCNLVPGLIEPGGLTGVAGLIAPRHLLAVSGRKDALFTESAIERAKRDVQAINQAAEHPRRFEHRWGDAGHRFYSELRWPFVLDALQQEE